MKEKRKKISNYKNGNANFRRKVRFFKQNGLWYADVPNHTLAENLMVNGADDLIESVSNGKPNVTVDVAWPFYTGSDWQFRLDRTAHNQHGATYSVTPSKGAKAIARSLGLSIVKQAWICNVTHDVLGDHPDSIFILSVKAA